MRCTHTTEGKKLRENGKNLTILFGVNLLVQIDVENYENALGPLYLTLFWNLLQLKFPQLSIAYEFG